MTLLKTKPKSKKSKYYISEGVVYRRYRNGQDLFVPSHKYSPIKLTPTDRYYLRKSTTYTDKSWIFFSRIENDFRLLHKPY